MDIAYSVNSVPIRLSTERWYHIVENHEADNMAQQTIAPSLLDNVLKAIPYLTRLPTERLWLDYDHEADVLYLSLERPQKATASKMRDDGILLRYRGKKLVGVTVFDASKR